jgi:hypothetical protein
MANLPDFTKTSIAINRFPIEQLTKTLLTVHEYSCTFSENPERGMEQKAIASVCYKLGVPSVRLGNKIITQEPVDSRQLSNSDYQLDPNSTRILDCANIIERKALESLKKKELEWKLKEQWSKTAIDKVDGGLIWWVTGAEGQEKCGNGWEIHKGRRIDIAIDSDGFMYLEIDLHHRFYTPWTLHQWLEKYPDVPIGYVRNTHRDKNNNCITWKYDGVADVSPEDFKIEDLGISLADYHRKQGATEEEINNSRVVYVRSVTNWKDNKLVPHLSSRLSPSLTMEMLSNIAERSEDLEKKNVEEVFDYIKNNLDTRLKESTKVARTIISKIYQIPNSVDPSIMDGFILPKAKLFGKNGEIDKTGKVRYKGCVKVGETKFGCLNLNDKRTQYPSEVEKCLKEIAKNSGTKIEIDSYRTVEDLPLGNLDRQIFWREWADTGVQTILVIAPWLPNEKKKQIRVEALQVGIATQFIIPYPKADPYKAMNVVLGMLCKAGWQTVRLEPLNLPEVADLIIGFDTGTNRELYYGTSAFAILADGQSLGWELPDVQRGERFSGESVWQTVSKLILRFYSLCQRYPRKLLLMRDGLVQEGEFQQTIAALNEKGIAVDVVSVRKSGGGRMGNLVDSRGEEITYQDAKIGSVVFMPKEHSFLLISSQPIIGKNQIAMGSARPLRVVREYGTTSLELLALQTYHLTQLHPASGFRSCRLPWVLQIADKSSKEFQRIGQISILQNLSREKLIAV